MHPNPKGKLLAAELKTVVEYAIGGCLIVFFVVLLTVIFSFVGTMICAALGGMMMGGAHCSSWRSCLVSLICPGVIATVLLVLMNYMTVKLSCCRPLRLCGVVLAVPATSAGITLKM